MNTVCIALHATYGSSPISNQLLLIIDIVNWACVARGRCKATWKKTQLQHLKHTIKQAVKTAYGQGECLAHMPQQQRPTAAKSCTALHVVCERSTTLKMSILGGQTLPATRRQFKRLAAPRHRGNDRLHMCYILYTW